VLWRLLRDRRMAGFKFRRQQPLGRYIADFVCLEHRLIIEADGSQHHENVRDAVRDAWLRAQGFGVLRFWNHDILTQPDMIVDTVHHALAGPDSGFAEPVSEHHQWPDDRSRNP
jgi:very-short-patch-repair endonuclease